MRCFFALPLLFISLTLLASKDTFYIISSPSVYPLPAVASELFPLSTSHQQPPSVESLKTEEGIRAFCSGTNPETPSLISVSRLITKAEYENCKKNNVNKILEIPIGYDGVVLFSNPNYPDIDLTTEQIFLALAKEVFVDGKLQKNPYTNWNDVDDSLPNKPITVYGPSLSSSAKESFAELILEKGCQKFPEIKKLKNTNEKKYKTLCHTLREDSTYISVEGNDNATVQEVLSNTNSIGLFKYTSLEHNSHRVKPLSLNDVSPHIESVYDLSYPGSKALFFYVKIDHIKSKPALSDFIDFFISAETEGDLFSKGLIPLSDTELKQVRRRFSNLNNSLF